MKFSLAFCIICATFPLLCSSALPTEIGYPEDDGNKQTVSEFRPMSQNVAIRYLYN